MDPSSKWSSRWWRRVGWPVGALGSAIMATLAFLLNLTILIWVSSTLKFEEGIAQVFAGDCHHAEQINTWAHFGINAVSAMLLSGSNYCMQILSAPTRKEIDIAHARRKWVDVGVPSVRNLKNVATWKLVMWWLLGLSSLPLHLLYNSVAFLSLSTNEYDIVFATKEFVEGGPQSTYNKTRFPDLESIQNRARTWDRLERAECINAYATEFLSTRRNLVAVVIENTKNENQSVKRVVPEHFWINMDTPNSFNPYNWICYAEDSISRYGYELSDFRYRFHCSALLPKVRANAERWHSYGWDIDYCLSEQVAGKCCVNFSLFIMIVVMVCNVEKALLMFLITFVLKDKPLITIGDAIDSFLNDSDQTTRGLCLSSKKSIKAGKFPQYGFEMVKDYDAALVCCYEAMSIQLKNEGFSKDWKADPVEYRSSVERWFSAVTPARWYSCLALYVINFTHLRFSTSKANLHRYFCCMLIVTLLLVIGINTANYNNNGVARSALEFINLGIGTVTPDTLISGWHLASIGGTTIIASVLISNIPQIILSFLYFLFNGVFTSMLLADEWSDYAHKRKPLRVSDPKPGQRSTYFLQLPYRYAVPYLILSGILHWTVSQSIFLAQVASYSKTGELIDPAAVSTCGYSPFGIALTLIVGTCLALSTVILSARRYKPGIPLAGSCSAAISAACHGGEDVDTTAPLKWGVTSPKGENVGHCAFSDKDVRRAKPGKLYAGVVTTD